MQLDAATTGYYNNASRGLPWDEWQTSFDEWLFAATAQWNVNISTEFAT